MATIKSYTDIEQSRKLAEILSLESADMKWFFWKDEIDAPKLPTFGYSKDAAENYKDTKAVYLPCWSLAALLAVLPDSIYNNTNEYSQLEFSKISVAYHDMYDGIKVGSIKDNLIDACYELILKLHESKML